MLVAIKVMIMVMLSEYKRQKSTDDMRIFQSPEAFCGTVLLLQNLFGHFGMKVFDRNRGVGAHYQINFNTQNVYGCFHFGGKQRFSCLTFENGINREGPF